MLPFKPDCEIESHITYKSVYLRWDIKILCYPIRKQLQASSPQLYVLKVGGSVFITHLGICAFSIPSIKHPSHNGAVFCWQFLFEMPF
ncbi:hypothetical protein FKM82_018883 [Ascaphus truei]